MPVLRSERRRLPAVLLIICFSAVALASTSAPVAAQVGAVCDAMTVDELNALSPLQYESANSQFAGCSYQPAPADGADHVVAVNRPPIGTINELVESFPGGEELTVAERPAYFIGGELWAQLQDGTVVIEAALGSDPDSEGIDALDYAILIAEIVVPQLDEAAAADEIANPVEPTPAEASLCDAISTDEINALSALQYGEPFLANATMCSYQASALQGGSHSVSLFREELIGFDDLKLFFAGGEDVMILDRRGYAYDPDLYVDMDDHVLTVVASFVGSPASEGMNPIDYAIEIAEIAVGNLQDGD